MILGKLPGRCTQCPHSAHTVQQLGLGLEEMSDGGVGTSDSGVDSSSGCCGSSATVSQADDVSESSSHMEDTSPSSGEPSSGGDEWEIGGSSSGFSTDVSDNRKRRRWRDNHEHFHSA